MKGTIEARYAVYCGVCCERDAEMQRSRESAAHYSRAAGWKRTKEHGWLCPKCVAAVSEASR